MQNSLFDEETLTVKKNFSLLKWVGGKKKLLHPIFELINRCYFKENTYWEPFLGGGAIAFSCCFPKMAIGDKNQKLIDFYASVKNDPEKLFVLVEGLSFQFSCQENKLDFFKNIKNKFNFEEKDILSKSAMFWFLNKAGFNGMYRENKKGEYNIPFAKIIKTPTPNIDDFLYISNILRSKDCILKCGDYQKNCEGIKEKDIVYFDPPYLPLSSTGFTSYTHDGFKIKNHIELRNFIEALSKKGVYVILSNSNSKETKEIYGNMDGFKLMEVEVNRLISGKSKGRGKIKELIIYNVG